MNAGINSDIEFMRTALDLAAEAQEAGEVPVGAVVVRGDAIIGRHRHTVRVRAALTIRGHAFAGVLNKVGRVA